MSKKNETDNPILKGLALVGGGYIFVELLKLIGKKKNYYTCTRCKYDSLEFGTPICPNCKSNLIWETK